ncbi:MAG: hypothetical protein ACPGQL_07850 [Thermoplasmatota archaeon]
MRTTTLLVAASLLAFSITAIPGVEAANEPVGGCGSDATVEYCIVQCVQPPCPPYVCVNSRLYTDCILP